MCSTGDWIPNIGVGNQLKQLYLVGGGTHPGSGLPTIFESSRITSKLICAEMGIDPDWNGMDPWFDELRRPSLNPQ